MMRLGFHYHTPAILQNGKIMMPAYLGLFIDSIATQCEKVVCFQHSPRSNELPLMDYAIRSSNVHLVDIGPHADIPRRTIKAFRQQQLVATYSDALDVLLIRAPTPILPFLAAGWRKPLALFLVGDVQAGIENLPQPTWRKWLISLWAKWYQGQQMRFAQRCLTFVNSQVLYDELGPIVPELILTRTTTLSKHDFFSRSDTCIKFPYRIMYAGRMARAKGLFEIVGALSELVQEGFDVVLDLVGMVERNDPILDELQQRALDLGIAERVTYHGYKSAGSELLAYYRRADVYVIASQSSSEGFPRTIWEAMASSVPVVATEVGSIPAFVQGAALLVPPKRTDVLTAGIRELFTNPDIRKSLITKGMALARENTLEKRGTEMVNCITEWLSLRELRQK